MKHLRFILPKRQEGQPRREGAPKALRLLAIVLSLTLAFGALLLNYTPTLAGTPVILNYPAGSSTTVSNVNFETQEFATFFDPAYSNTEVYERTRYPEGFPADFPTGTSGKLNGATGATDKHIVLAGDQARFFGYASTPYFDYLFSQNNAIGNPIGMEFDMEPGKWNFHCFKRTGIFLKSERHADGTISGYLLSIGSNSVGTVAQNSANILDASGNVIQPDLSYAIFKVDHMNINAYNDFIDNYSVEGLIQNDNGEPSEDFDGDGFSVMDLDGDGMLTTGEWDTDDYHNVLFTNPDGSQENLLVSNNANTQHVFNESKFIGQFYSMISADAYSVTGTYQGSNSNYLDYYFEGNYGLPKGAGITQVALVNDPSFSLLTTGMEKMHMRIEYTGPSILVYTTMHVRNAATGALEAMPEQLLFNVPIDAGLAGNNGFGLFCQYLAHACQMLTHITFSGTQVTTPDPLKPPTTARVRFQQYGTGATLGVPDETKNGFAGDQYRIDPTPIIEYGGKTYRYYRSSRWSSGSETLDPLTYNTNPTQNETTLYYVESPTLKKDAQVGTGRYTIIYGAINNGSAASPVVARYGNRIRYTLTIGNPSGTTMNNFNATLTDRLPSGLTYVSSTTTPTTVNPGYDGMNYTTLIWKINTLPAAGLTIQVVCSVNVEAARFENTASLLCFGEVADGSYDPAIYSNTTYHQVSTLAPTISKTARTIPGNLTGAGSSMSPIEVDFDGQIEYTLTINNPNTFVIEEDVKVTDKLPAGLEYVSSTPAGTKTTSGVGAAARDTVVWTISDLPVGNTTIKVLAKVIVGGNTFANYATMNVPGLSEKSTNYTYHKTGLVPVTGTKTARVLPSGATNSGTETVPVVVEAEQQVEYTISVNNQNIPGVGASPNYDVVFALDWSGSMGSNRTAAKNLIAQLCGKVFTDYPDSRISIMGLNCTHNLTYNPINLFLQIDTPFVRSDAYDSHLSNAFSVNPTFMQDDMPMFIRAATDKFANVANVYGGNGSEARTPVLRGASDNIPVLVLIADNSNADGGQMQTQLQRFKTLFPDGIVIGLCYGAGFNGGWAYMDAVDNVNWRHMTVNAASSVDAVYDVFKGAVVTIPVIETTVEDLLPAGMTYVSSTPAGATTSVDAATGRTRVRWHFDDIGLGIKTFKIVTRVTKNRIAETDYDNVAEITAAGQSKVVTNMTYHRMTNTMKLHIRQMVMNRDGTTVPLPAAGYLKATNNGLVLGLETLSGLEGKSQTPFTEYFLPLNTDPLYLMETIVPQYYSYAGYVATTTNTPHSSGSRTTGSLTLDYTNNYEQWLTVYLIPQEPGGRYTTDSRTNDFGKLHVTPPAPAPPAPGG
ncbi:MAG: DUF11 domain-containing protein [Oscillospiraceae bacterium]|nr:DUF11 domain-containing protein [Oscillospiraceae bacterium]